MEQRVAGQPEKVTAAVLERARERMAAHEVTIIERSGTDPYVLERYWTDTEGRKWRAAMLASPHVVAEIASPDDWAVRYAVQELEDMLQRSMANKGATLAA